MTETAKKVRRCRVVDCANEHLCMFLLPSAEPLKRQWLDFIFAGDTPTELPKAVHVCAKHFTKNCFTNLGGYESGLYTRLRIERGSVPTIRDVDIKEEVASPPHSPASPHLPSSVDVGCLTDTLEKRTVCTQLSFRTLHTHYRSSGIQATVSCKDVGVGTPAARPFYFSSTAARRTSKRHRPDSEDELELEENFERTNSLRADCVTALTEPSDLSEQSSAPVPNGRKFVVYESCLTELFSVCPGCMRTCDVQTEDEGTFLSVTQRCPRCQFHRHWSSRPDRGRNSSSMLH